MFKFFNTNRNKNQKVFCILGMHRSGTSCLTGIIEEAGVYLGNVSKKNLYNLKGNQENNKIVGLHTDVLSANHGSWDNPPSSVNFSRKQIKSLKKIIKEYKHYECWGFKDPRTIYTLDYWTKEIPEMSIIGTFRHPVSVANSLANRDNMSLTIDEGINLWIKYNTKLLEHYEKYHFDLLCFDLPQDIYINNVIEVLKKHNLNVSSEQICFFEKNLRTWNPENANLESVPTEAIKIYEKLKEISFSYIKN